MLRSMLGLMFVGLLAWGMTACSPNKGRCAQNYNCPEGWYCVRGVCQETNPDQNKGEKTSEPVADNAADAGKEPVPEKEPPKGECSQDDDCKDSKKPYCREKKCVEGYMTFDFSIGHLVIDLSGPTQTCQSSSQCKPGFVCSQGQCRLGATAVGQKSTANGKVAGENFFLVGYSYSTLAKRNDGKNVVRTIMIGSLSEKLDKVLEVDVPVERFTSGKFTCDNVLVSARLYDVYKEFVPARRVLRAYGVAGLVSVADAGKNYGRRVSGKAELILKKFE